MRWLPLERNNSKPAANSARSASVAVQRGSLGIHLDGRRQDLLAEKKITLLGRERLEAELNCFFNVGQRLFERVALRLAPFQLGAPSVKAVLVFFDYDARFAGH